MNEIQKIIIDYSTKDLQNLEIAYETKRCFPYVLDSITNEFCKLLIDRLITIDQQVKWNIVNQTRNERINIHFEKVNWPENTRLSIIDVDNDRLCFSVQTNEPNKDVLQQNLDKINKVSVNTARFWFKLSNPYNKWDNSFEGIKAMSLFGNIDNALNYFLGLIISNSQIVDDFLLKNTGFEIS